VPRKPRQEEAGAIHHVYARGNNRHRTYVDDVDRRRYLALLAAVARDKGWNCLAYCLMPNHMHLLIETPQPNLGEGMHALQGEYARTFNVRHGRLGHVFQGRYRHVRISDDDHLATALGYIALNPVAAGLCSHPEDWPWSSHLATSCGEAPPWLAAERLFSLLSIGGDPKRQYAEIIAARLELIKTLK
jgi:REP element-mobilizing transposase RayT